MHSRRYVHARSGKTHVVGRVCVQIILTLATMTLAQPVLAGAIEDRVHRHVAQAIEGGLLPADYHHLVFAFSWPETFEDWTIARNGLDRLAGVQRADPLMVDEVRAVRARFEVDSGRDAAAYELFRTTGGLTAWWFRDPIPLEELADFDRMATSPTEDFVWRATPGTDPLGWVRLTGLAWPSQRQMAYLATTIVSETEQPVAVRVGVAQVARVWLNGVEVLTTPQPLAKARDQMVGGGWVRQGANTLVIAVASEDENWWLRARLTQPGGAALVGVRESEELPAVRSPVEKDPPEVRGLGKEIREARDAGTPGGATALAAFLVVHKPEPLGGGSVRAACRAARSEAAGEARLLEWLATSEPGLARDLLAEALAEDPDLLWARLELAAWYGERTLYEQAHNLLAAADTADPMVRGAMLGLDEALWGPMVIPRMAALGSANPRCVRVNVNLTEGAIEARRWDLATDALSRLVEVAPGEPKVIELNQRLAESCGDGEKLVKLLSDDLQRDPNSPATRIRLSRLLMAEEDLTSARAVLTGGLDRSPTDVNLMMELASVEHSAGDEERAAELASNVLEIRPQNRRAERMLELLGQRSDEIDWMRKPAELWNMAEAAPPGSPAVVVLDHRQVRFFASRLTEERVQQVFMITDASRADELRVQHIPFVAENERLRVLRARILRRDGTEVGARQGNTPRLSEPEFNLYYDTRLRVVQFDEFENGDLVEIAWVLAETDEANETGPYNGGLIYLGRGVPVAQMEVEFVGLGDLLPDWQLALLEGEPERTEDPDGLVRLRWVWRDLPAVPTDVPPAPRLLITPHLVYSNHPEWGGLADWFARHVAPRIRTSEQVEETAFRLVDGVDGRRERISRLYRFVTNEIRYVGLEFGEHRFRPFSADWVLHHQIGDCKDKAALLVALLGAIEIPARMVMTRTADIGPVSTDLAVLEIFNHAIVYLPEDDLWLDGTATGHAMSPPPPMDQGAWVLVIDGPNSAPRFSPTVGAGRSRVHFVVEPEGDGNVRVAIESRDTGEAADIRRARFAGSRDPQRFARWLQEQFPGAQLTGEPRLQVVPGRDPTIVEVEGTITRSALASGGGIPAYPGTLEWAARMIPGGERHGPIMVNERSGLEWELEVDLGRPPRPLPPDVKLETEFGSLGITNRESSSGYVVEGELAFVSGLVEADDADALREFLVEVERHLRRPMEAP